MKRLVKTGAAVLALGAPAAAAAQGSDVWFYCLGLNPDTGAVAVSNVFPGQTGALEVYKQQIASYLISLDLLPETGGEIACAWAADEATAQQEVQDAASPSDVRFAYAPQVLGAGVSPLAPADAVREPNAIALSAAEVAAIEERNRREAERAAQLAAEHEAREAARQAAYDAERAAYEAAQDAYQAEQAAYQENLARQQAAQAAYEAQRAAYEAALQATTPY